MFDLLFETLGQTALGAFQGAVGLLWPPKNAEVRRLQRWCLLCLVAFLISVALMALFLLSGWWPLTLLLAAIALLLGWVCGTLGAAIEKKSGE